MNSASKKEFLDLFKKLCYTRSSWEVWADLITAMACSLSNVTDRTEPRFESREKEYAKCIKRLGGVEKPAHLFGIIVNALERDPDQDFLGSLYMELNLGNHWKGQFFTPYTVSRMMAETTIGSCEKEIEEKGWISVCDPCVGGGAMLIAAANTLQRQQINYQNHVLFVGQDIDRVVGMMAYIQLSLMGCPGYIVIGNSLTNPVVGSPLMPAEQEGQEFWYTPLYNSKVWHWRRAFAVMDSMSKEKSKFKKQVNQENKFYFFFNFDKEVEV